MHAATYQVLIWPFTISSYSPLWTPPELHKMFSEVAQVFTTTSLFIRKGSCSSILGWVLQLFPPPRHLHPAMTQWDDTAVFKGQPKRLRIAHSLYLLGLMIAWFNVFRHKACPTYGGILMICPFQVKRRAHLIRGSLDCWIASRNVFLGCNSAQIASSPSSTGMCEGKGRIKICQDTK